MRSITVFKAVVKASLALCLCVIQLVPEVIVMVDLLWNVALLIRAQMNKKNTWRR